MHDPLVKWHKEILWKWLFFLLDCCNIFLLSVTGLKPSSRKKRKTWTTSQRHGLKHLQKFKIIISLVQPDNDLFFSLTYQTRKVELKASVRWEIYNQFNAKKKIYIYKVAILILTAHHIHFVFYKVDERYLLPYIT